MATSHYSGERFSWRVTLRNLLSLNDTPWRWSAGVQAGIALGVPLALFTLAGHQSLGLIASLGAFTALYCPTLHLRDRLYVLPLVGAGFVAASVLGVLGAGDIWLTIACLIVVAGLSCTIVFGVGLGPPGPMQFVLVTGITGHMAAPTSLGGASIDGHIIPLLVAVGAVGAYLLVIAPLALPSVRRREGVPTGFRAIFPLSPFNREKAIITVRVVVAVAIASLLSLPLGVHRSYWVIMVAGAVLQASYTMRLVGIRVAQRLLGTFLGVAVFGLVALIEPRGIWLVGIIALLQFAIEVVVGRNYALALIFITPVALMISAAVGTDSLLIMAGERLIDSLLGAVIAVAVLWIGKWVEARSTHW